MSMFNNTNNHLFSELNLGVGQFHYPLPKQSYLTKYKFTSTIIGNNHHLTTISITNMASHSSSNPYRSNTSQTQYSSDSDSDHDSGYETSFFQSPDEAPEPGSSSTPPPSTSSAKTFFTSTNSAPKPSRKAARKAQKTARHAQRRAQKKAEQAKAQAEAEARKARYEEDFRKFTAALDKASYWNSLANSQKGDAERFGVHYLALTNGLQAFRTDLNAPFPKVKNFGCQEAKCAKNDVLNCCICDFEKVLRGSGSFSKEWLRKERLGWHPDKFSGPDERMEDARLRAGEVFKLFQKLLDN